MDEWKNELKERFDAGDWSGCIIFLKGKLNHSDDMDLYLNLLYLYMYYLVDVEDNQECFIAYQNEIKQYYKQASDLYMDRDEFLFYICFIASMSEWFLDLTMDDLKQIVRTIFRRHPENLLFKWEYALFCENSIAQLGQRDLVVINDAKILKELSEKSVLGDAVLNFIKYKFPEDNI